MCDLFYLISIKVTELEAHWNFNLRESTTFLWRKDNMNVWLCIVWLSQRNKKKIRKQQSKTWYLKLWTSESLIIKGPRLDSIYTRLFFACMPIIFTLLLLHATSWSNDLLRFSSIKVKRKKPTNQRMLCHRFLLKSFSLLTSHSYKVTSFPLTSLIHKLHINKLFCKWMLIFVKKPTTSMTRNDLG